MASQTEIEAEGELDGGFPPGYTRMESQAPSVGGVWTRMRQAAETAMSPQILEILIFVAVAAFLLFRLRGVLGTRTGHEDPNDGTRRPGFGRRPPRADESDVVIPLRPVPVEVEPPVEEVELPDLAALGVDASLRKQLQALMRVEPGVHPGCISCRFRACL